MTLATTELAPLSLRLDAANAQVSRIPPGAVFDPASRTVRWIPTRGQAGQHRLDYTQDGSLHSLTIRVDAIDETLLRAGPPVPYADGEIGYIFLHGKTDDDLCQDGAGLNDYWGDTINILAPVPSSRRVVCYDGRQAVVDQAHQVARQISDASCGSFGRCILVAHSMGGLMIEHILHRAPADPTFAAAQSKVLLVLAMASAAGGSKAADVVVHPGRYPIAQEAIGRISDFFGAAENSTQNLVPDVAASVAPINSTAKTPFFMVAGYSLEIVTEAGDLGGLLGGLFSDGNDHIFNGDTSYAALDLAVSFRARSDGIVSFRSSCGAASVDMEAGPARAAPISEHFDYCATTPKRPSHYPWLLANQNHSHIVLPGNDCPKIGCNVDVFDPTQRRFVESTADRDRGVVRAIRRLLHDSSASGGLQRRDVGLSNDGRWH